MTSQARVLKSIQGFGERFNDIIYVCPSLSLTRNLLVFFGGDVQDIETNMKNHENSKKYLEWSLEKTGNILSERFPENHVIIVRPSRTTVTSYAVYSCFDNFVIGNNHGVPIYQPSYNSLQHLHQLIKTCLQVLKISDSMQMDEVGSISLTLIGFSKGCVVLNQFLHEFHHYEIQPINDTNLLNFISCIKHMWWLDGGHGGFKDTWITDTEILESFAKMKMKTHIHVTPYQMEDKRRPWIQKEHNCFEKTLLNLGVSVDHKLHFPSQTGNLFLHFNVLKAIRNLQG